MVRAMAMAMAMATEDGQLLWNLEGVVRLVQRGMLMLRVVVQTQEQEEEVGKSMYSWQSTR